MAHIQKRGDSYLIQVTLGRDADGKRIYNNTTFRPDPFTRTGKPKSESMIEKEVQSYAAEFERACKSGDILTEDGIKFSVLVDSYLENYAFRELARTTAEGYEGILRKVIVPRFGFYSVRDLCKKTLEIQSFINSLASGEKPLATSTIKRYTAVFSSVMSWAVQMGIAAKNPLDRIKPPKEAFKEPEPKSFSIEELNRFFVALDMPIISTYKAHSRKSDSGPVHIKEFTECREIPEQFKVFFTLSAFTGCRRGELVALDWDNVDFENCIIRICKSCGKVKGGQIIKDLKTASGRRVVTVDPEVMDLLNQWRIHQEELQMKMGTAWKGEGAVFIQDDGRRMYLDTPTAKFRDIIQNYNSQCEPEDRLPEISLHGLRHTHASIMVNQNVDIAAISKRLGHSRTSVTLDFYTHAMQDSDRVASDKFSSAVNLPEVP